MLIIEGWIPEGSDQAPDAETLERFKGKRARASLNGEIDEVDRLEAELAMLQSAAS